MTNDETAMRLKVRETFFECDKISGHCRITLPNGRIMNEDNPRIAFIKFMQHVEYDLIESFLDCMEDHGFNRYTGRKVE